MLLIGFGDV